jgi:hypothetical protein
VNPPFAIADALKIDTTLQKINLRYNKISNAGAIEIGQFKILLE